MSIIKGLFKVFTSVSKGVESGFKIRGKGFSWQLEDLKHTNYLYDGNHIKHLADQAITSGSHEQMALIKQYIKRHGAEKIPSYKSIIQSIDKKLKPPKTDHQMIMDLKKEIEHMKHLLNGKGTSFHETIDTLKEFI